ncbi:hypothetical protein RNV14_004486 [Salmonella enterica]|uniref:hypothetical protein n=2 Tax=Enterobacteriaceae TaxID=543 RepID=UPI0004504037|nr:MULTISPECIES: hypothetical protein [Enterobacteriaceae]EBL8482878.1 hypothetical protein [Salmonella enterica]ECH1063902.1 hypothetical protein [Salmonella enterica subsp. enterica serovar Enteritidis]ECH6682539.1 hypothetical protein [Salmonella enterica subsp. enterica serovar Indiana]EIU8269809.1 hypothetical protein [Salmonella enterica subsp. enterica serovar Infantis]EKW4699327.1 hypothetical protein [Raoultella ornithinolytica]QNM21462.1 hypothetical protein CXM87_26855 [Citrobacter
MKNGIRNIKEDVLQKVMYRKLICYGVIVFIAGTLIMSDINPMLNALLNKISSIEAVFYTLLVILLLEVITYLTYNSFKLIKNKRNKKELDLIIKGYSEGFNDGIDFQKRGGNNNIGNSINKAENKTTKENDYDR